MDKSRLPPGIPQEGFLKLTGPGPVELTNDQKAALIRRGNALLHEGDIQQARRIFITTGYRDGMVRAADKLVQTGDVLGALQLYYLANEREKAQELIARMADVVKFWIRSDA